MGEAYLAFAEEEPGFYAAMFSTRPRGRSRRALRGSLCGSLGPDGRGERGQGWDEGAVGAGGRRRPGTAGAFNLLVNGLMMAFPDGFGGVDPRFLALQVWALAHGLATLSAAGQLPEGAGLPDKRALLRAGVAAIVDGAAGRKGAA
jgi:hypothetical protein